MAAVTLTREEEAEHLPLPQYRHYTCTRCKTSSFQWKEMDEHISLHPGDIKVKVKPACGYPFESGSGTNHLCTQIAGHSPRHGCNISKHGCCEKDGDIEEQKNERLWGILSSYNQQIHHRGDQTKVGLMLNAARKEVDRNPGK